MSDGSIVNSDKYWDGRFSDDWESCDGPRQSRFFARLAVENLPAWLVQEVRRQSLTVADWGCAQGDGTDSLASHIDARQLVGVDFSEVAIEQAKSRYPAIRFLAENWVGHSSGEDRTFDVVFSSNTLEHFHNPWEVLEFLAVRAAKAVVLALPYRELDRIDEHFYSFLPENVPFELSNGFGLVWSKVIDCSQIEGTLWSGEQIFLVYAEKSWLNALKLTLADSEIGREDTASLIAECRAVHAREDLEHADRLAQLVDEVAAKDARISGLELERAGHVEKTNGLAKAMLERDAQITRMGQDITLAQSQISSLQHEAQRSAEAINGFINSRSWRVTRPLRATRRFFNAISDASERYQLLKSIYWKLPEALRSRLSSYRYRYVARNLHVREAGAPVPSHAMPDPEWVMAANAAQKTAIIPCGFEFDELVNQRPINAAKYFSQHGYTVIFIAWQWSRGERLSKPSGQVWPGVYQVPLYEFVDFEKSLAYRKVDALYLLTMPARVLADLVPSLRGRGYSIVYDVMDEWEEFHRSGQAPWFERDVERNLVLQSDVVSAVAPALIEKFSMIRDDIQLLGNGYSVNILGEGFRGIAGKDHQGPLKVGYFGHLTDAWFDWRVVFALAQAHPEIQFELIGYGEPEWVRERVLQVENVKLLGKVHPKELNVHVRRWKYGIIPFMEGKLAQAVDPIKIYEYLYFGLPSFVTGIEHLASYPNVAFAKSADATHAFGRFLEAGKSEDANLEDFLAKTTWDARFAQLQDCLSRKVILGDMYAS